MSARKAAGLRAKRSKHVLPGAADATCGASSPEETIAALESAVQARDDFIAIAGHELRNPMTPIQAQVELLLDAARRDPGAAALLPRVEKLQRLVGVYLRRTLTLLDVARLNAGAPALEITETDLSEIVRDAAKALEPIAQGAGCAILLDIAAGIIGRWDKGALEQVVDNLLTNAIKYGAGAPIAVTLACHDGHARLAVRDQGCGIPEEDQRRIFARFERAVGRGGAGGFGLGLWISRRLICSMGGEIVVASRPEEGSCFTVILPLRSD